MKRNSDILYSEADYMLSAAHVEMQKAKEDVVAHQICYQSRQSITNYLRGFLMHHGLEPQLPLSMQHLLAQCREVDARFQKLDLTDLPCRTEEGHASYCLSVDKVEECLATADRTRELVRPLD